MTWIEKLFGTKHEDTLNTAQVNAELVAVQKVLTSVDDEQAPFVACLALLAARLAGADMEISEGEKKRIAEVLQKQTHLSGAEAAAAAQIASAQELAQSIEHQRITSLMNDLATMEQKEEIIRSLFYVACDEDISEVESEKIRSIATAMLVSNDRYIKIRSEFSEHRTLLKNLP